MVGIGFEVVCRFGRGGLLPCQFAITAPRIGFAVDLLPVYIAELLTRPVGRPSHKPVAWYKSFLHQAASCKTARRVVAKVEFHFELFPRVGFIVTNLETDSRAVVGFYNKRGTAEQWIKEGKQAPNPMHT